ncbi:hypothetical protein CJ467_21605 [Bacillus velezensis]|uniref:hypothetical protein n=1 Tax=Bacillus velezensis TaxID=492670 RepID=UPI000BA7C224|nr:hypothetical protein [Bacillus velezensis]PAK28275.1 hypothetical protein CJ467_21605 [Bacillus velezensis]
MTRKYIVIFKDKDPVVLLVKDDVNRPNNPDCDSVLHLWVAENYGNQEYDYLEISACDHYEI